MENLSSSPALLEVTLDDALSECTHERAVQHQRDFHRMLRIAREALATCGLTSFAELKEHGAARWSKTDLPRTLLADLLTHAAAERMLTEARNDRSEPEQDPSVRGEQSGASASSLSPLEVTLDAALSEHTHNRAAQHQRDYDDMLRFARKALAKRELTSFAKLEEHGAARWSKTKLPGSLLVDLLAHAAAERIATEMAEKHASHLEQMLSDLEPQRHAAFDASRQLLSETLGDAFIEAQTFGSHRYDAAMPSSDLDLVALVDKAVLGCTSATSFDRCACDELRKFTTLAKEHDVFKSVQFAVPKRTVILKYGSQHMDITMSCPGEHSPLRLSEVVSKLISDAEASGIPACGLRRVTRLILDWAAQNRFCNRRSKNLELLKSIHWVILVWTACHFDCTTPLPLTLSGCAAHVFSFLANFEFERYGIHLAEAGPRIVARDGAFAFETDIVVIVKEGTTENMCYMYKSDNPRHGGLTRLRSEASEAFRRAGGLTTDNGGLWRELAERWRHVDATQESPTQSSSQGVVGVWWSLPSIVANLVSVGPAFESVCAIAPETCLAEAMTLAEQLGPFCEWRQYDAKSTSPSLWPFCCLCDCWADSSHVAGKRHKNAMYGHPWVPC
eukprot:TRINITY_DN3942_c0_g1_i1.p1 TRINITY_DN3942_c0_g1~~TRINITY_DN3942_c0_g1_i1.p1  ORF type:complete len:618 (+),score=51.69 TRINITY_DN3942_c0_g1_i1:52-1905(+)